MTEPKPIVLTQVDAGDYDGEFEPKPYVVVGPLPDSGGEVVPAPPETGTFVLTSTDGVLSWEVPAQ